MDVLNEISIPIAQDFSASLAAIAANDSLLLETYRPRIIHYASVLRNLMPVINGSRVGDLCAECILRLQELLSAINRISDWSEIGSFNDLPMTVENVVHLRELDIPWAKIAVVFGVSRQSIYNFRVRHNIGDPYQRIDDEELRDLMIDLTFTNPEAGAVYLKGMLRGMGIKASMSRIKQHLRQVDPCGVLLRRSQRIHRREYRVEASNYIWHIDSNHKLIAFRFVLHGCTDGFSRKIIYLRASTNNLADTVLSFFEEGVEACGLPKRVRGDRGVENVRVKDFMELQRPETTNPFIQGRSVHNTRIERLWRETNLHVVSKYKAIFHHLESLELLDEHDEVDLFCLSYVFFPRIQQDLDAFKEFYNNHSVRTMYGRTPLQVWTVSMMQQSSAPIQDASLQNNYNNDEYYFSDYFDSGCPTENNQNDSFENVHIEVPLCSLSCAERLNISLAEVVPDPTTDDGNFGIEHYIHVRNFVLNESFD